MNVIAAISNTRSHARQDRFHCTFHRVDAAYLLACRNRAFASDASPTPHYRSHDLIAQGFDYRRLTYFHVAADWSQVTPTQCLMPFGQRCRRAPGRITAAIARQPEDVYMPRRSRRRRCRAGLMLTPR